MGYCPVRELFNKANYTFKFYSVEFLLLNKVSYFNLTPWRFRWPRRRKLQFLQCLRRGTEAQGHNSWLLAEADLRARSPPRQRAVPGASHRCRRRRRRGSPGRARSHCARRPGQAGPAGSLTPMSPSKNPPWSPGRWPWLCSHGGTGLGIGNERVWGRGWTERGPFGRVGLSCH